MQRILCSLVLLLMVQYVFAQIPTNGLVAYYPFNGNANDEAQSHLYNGTVNGATLTTDRNGNPNSAYSFDGVSNWINTTYQQNNLTQFTVSAWVKTNMNGGNNSYSVIQNRGPNTPGGVSMTLAYWKDSGKWFFGADGYGIGIYQSKIMANSNEWMHIAGVWQGTGSAVDANQMKLFINGQLVPNTPTNISGASIPITGTGSMKIAFHESFNTYFEGSIDDIRIYERALADNEVQAIYQAESPVDLTNGLVAYYPFNGNANDESGNGNHGIVNGATSTTDRFGNVDKAYSFDGVSKRITISNAPQINFSSSFSFSYWLKANSWGNSISGGIISKKASDVANGYVVYNDGFYPDKINVRLQGQTYYHSASLVEINNWHQWTVTYDATNSLIKIFRDGVLDVTYTNNVGDLTNSTNLYFGYAETWNQYLNGALDDIRFYNRAISQQEVTTLYQSEVPPVTLNTGLVAYYPFNGNVNDESGNGNHGTPNGASLTTDRIGKSNRAFNFDGVSNTIEVNTQSNVLGSSPRTLSAWVKIPENSISYKTIYKGGTNGDGNDFTFIFKTIGTNQAQLYLRRFNNDVWSETISYSANEWYHVAVTFDGTNTSGIKFYLNSNLLATQNGGASTFNTLPTNPTIGDHISQGNFHSYLNGKIDEVRVYNRLLNLLEIQELYHPTPSAISSPPQITLSSANPLIGQTLNIIGSSFTPNSQAEINIQDDNNFTTTQNVNINSIGTFNFPFNISNSLNGGYYTVIATDIATNIKANPGRRFYLQDNNAITPIFTIQNPKAGTQYFVNNLLNINWSDLFQSNTIQNAVSKNYRIEVSLNNGNWYKVQEIIKRGIVNQINAFYFNQYAPNQVGNYQIKISDIDNPPQFILSEVFTVLPDPNVGFDFSMEWDHSNNVATDTKVKGVAADGVARIYFKITKKDTPNQSLVLTKVQISLSDPETTYLDYKVLGKLMPVSDANKLTNYSIEANNATSISVNTTSKINNSFWFWYVAPDDFNRSITGDDFRGNRIVKVKIEAFYNNSTTPDETLFKDLEIVRPPLMLVHGLGGDENTWGKTVFTSANNIITKLRYANNIFSAGIQTNNLYKNVAFEVNANLLLGVNRRTDLIGKTYQNSFQDLLTKTKTINGYAANRVDYVCHSMGGCVIRTAINKLNSNYIPSENSSLGYKNYNAGFVNKLITLNTPHNGSCGADLIVDEATRLPNFAKELLHGYFYKKDGVAGVYLEETFDKFILASENTPIALFKYKATPAVKNMRFFKSDIHTDEGIRFNETKVKNHLIAGKVSDNEIESITYLKNSIEKIVNSNSYSKLYLNFLDYSFSNFGSNLLKLAPYAIRNYVNSKMTDYGNPSFMESSDFVVPLSSQLPGKNLSQLGNNSTLFHGGDYMHVSVTDQLPVGNRIMELLNKPIASDYFADKIAANDNPKTKSSDLWHKREAIHSGSNAIDSLIEYIDTTKIKLISPVYSTSFRVDSSITIKLNLKDTLSYKRTSLLFQGQEYNSISKADTILFKLKVNPEAIDTQLIMIAAIYDSIGFRVYHYDFKKIIVKPDSLCQKLIVSPNSILLNPQEKYIPTITGIHPTYITSISVGNPSLTLAIADTNVVVFDSIRNHFVAKDTGNTFVVYSYAGLKDTQFVNITIPTNDIPLIKKCPGQNIYYKANVINGATYRWQVNSGTGFSDLVNNSFYSGVDSNTISLVNIPTSYRGNKYRCIINNGPVTTYSNTEILQFGLTWQGTSNSEWTNPTNWSCSTIPDQYVDVIIPSNKPTYPTVNLNASVNSLKLEPGSTVNIAPNIKLDIKSKQ